MEYDPQINDLHAIWFADSLSSPEKARERFGVWFSQSDDLDKQLVPFREFPDLVLSGKLELALSDPRSLVCSVLIVDQLPRNFYRGSGKAFAYDTHALGLCRAGMKSAIDTRMHILERLFLYMPLQHTEDLQLQELSLTVYSGLVQDSPEEWKPLMEGALGYARKHHEIVKQFGRFPHRNELLGRETTTEEAAWLKEGGERFGQ